MDSISCASHFRANYSLIPERRAQRPEPLDQKRRKSLATAEAEVNSQTQSPIFSKLPIELRQAIFEAAGLVSARTIHLFTYEKKIHGKLCTLPPKNARPYYDAAQNHCEACNLKAYQVLGLSNPAKFIHVPPRGVCRNQSVLPLLQTCRRTYCETIYSLYQANEFSFTDLWTLVDFLDTIPNSYSNRIRSISLTWALVQWNFRDDEPPYNLRTWQDIWSRVSELQGLRTLRVELSDCISKRTCGNLNALPPPQRASSVAAQPNESPKQWWMSWLGPIKVLSVADISGFICCRFEDPASVHVRIESRETGRVVVFADGTEETY